MRVRDLQQILHNFTSKSKGNALSDCEILMETKDGYLEDIRRIEVQECILIGINTQRVVLKADNELLYKSRTFKKT
jgi:hypothetical protein